MIKIEWKEPNNFSQWQEKSKKATKRAIQTFNKGEKVHFEASLWLALKNHLFSLSFGKCALCESTIHKTSIGDLIHHRPISKVDGEDEHPGYYWLAYTVLNLLPTCSRCRQAKDFQFPVVEGTRAYHVGDLDQEVPFLLNPFMDDPHEHLDFDENGKIISCTIQGKVTIQVYDLNRAELVVERKNSQEIAEVQFLDALMEFVTSGKPFENSMNKVIGKEAEFSQAVKSHLEKRIKVLEDMHK